MTQKLLHVTAPHFVAGAIWENRNGWTCVNAAPILKWMKGKDARFVKQYLDKKQWKYIWL